MSMPIPFSHMFTTCTGNWLKLGSCADIWISSGAKGSGVVDSTNSRHSHGSRCLSQSSSSTAKSGDISGGVGGNPASNSGGSTRNAGSFGRSLLKIIFLGILVLCHHICL